jgi:hypothetical protein
VSGLKRLNTSKQPNLRRRDADEARGKPNDGLPQVLAGHGIDHNNGHAEPERHPDLTLEGLHPDFQGSHRGFLCKAAQRSGWPASSDLAPPPYPTDELRRYPRAQAIADGVLVDVSREASPAGMLGGFAVPVAVTAALWSTIESIPRSLVGIADTRGRLHDVLWMAALAARRHRGDTSVPFLVHLPSRGTRMRTVRLVVAIGPGDDGEPVVTIGYPEDF